jgi:hypothetical protein
MTESAIRFTKDGVVDESGNEHKVDVVVCATGFDVSFTPHFEVIGRNAANLKGAVWGFSKSVPGNYGEELPQPFLWVVCTTKMLQTLTISLVLIGPNGPANHGPFLPILEWHTRYMFRMINKLQTENVKAFEPKEECMKELYNHTHELMKRLVWSTACRSWFKLGKEHGPVMAIYPRSRLHYFEMMKNV